MRFMIMVRADTEATADFHRELARAGVLLDAGGYTLIQARSREEAMAWARRFPASGAEAEIELRPLNDTDEVTRLKAPAR